MPTRHVEDGRKARVLKEAVLERQEREALYEYKAPEDLNAYHVIVKVAGEDGEKDWTMHYFVFAEDGGAAINSVVPFWAKDSQAAYDLQPQFTCRQAKQVMGGVYLM